MAFHGLQGGHLLAEQQLRAKQKSLIGALFASPQSHFRNSPEPAMEARAAVRNLEAAHDSVREAVTWQKPCPVLRHSLDRRDTSEFGVVSSDAFA